MSLRKGFITYIDISNPPPTNYTLYMNTSYTSSHIQATNQTPTTQNILGNNTSSNSVLLPANGDITISVVTAYSTSNSVTGSPYPVSCIYDPYATPPLSGSQSCQDTTTNTDTYTLVMKEYDSSSLLLATHTITTLPYTFTPNANTKYIEFTWQYQSTTSSVTTTCGNCRPPLELYMNNIGYSPSHEIHVSSWGAVQVFGNDTSSNPKTLLYNGTYVTVQAVNYSGYTTLIFQETDGSTTLVNHNVPLPQTVPYTFTLHPNTTDILFGFLA